MGPPQDLGHAARGRGTSVPQLGPAGAREAQPAPARALPGRAPPARGREAGPVRGGAGAPQPVWQTDFTEFETSRGGTWRLAPVVDYAAKVCFAAPVSGTTSARDAIHAIEAAIDEAERLLGHPLVSDCIDPETGEIEPVTIVTDNGPAYKSTDFLRFIRSHPELAHVRTRHHAPETNGVVERFNESLKYEHLYRLEIPDVLTLVEEAEAFRQLYNTIRPHEALDFATPITAYLAHPGSHLSEPESVQES